jgi:hypothetical protein
MRHIPAGTRILYTTTLAAIALLLGSCGPSDSAPDAAGQPAPAASTAIAYEGARLIPGNGAAPIENGTFVVNNGRFVAVGASGAVVVPDGAQHVDLRGATVMPTIIDTHTHLSTEREPLLEDLRRRATYGVSAALSLGMDGTDATYQVRELAQPGIALYRTAGRGITSPEPGRSDVPHWVTTEDEARAAVREEAAHKVDIVKIWVDDRNGQYDKLPPAL